MIKQQFSVIVVVVVVVFSKSNDRFVKRYLLWGDDFTKKRSNTRYTQKTFILCTI